jgi:hypothetical protein
MINSQALKTFVKMHEYKLNAKVNALEASRLHDKLEQTTDEELFETEDQRLDAHDNRYLQRFAEVSEKRRRPKSRYFNFIVTTGHH